MGKIGAQVLQGIRNLFGKRESNQTPQNLDIIQFNSATQEWELVSGVIGTAVQSSSNVGAGQGVALPRVGDDLPFRSLTTTSRISLTGSATEIEIDIGILNISDITGLQTALDNLEPPFLISDITGLQTELDSKLESPINISDVTNLQTELDSKLESPINISDVTNLQTELDTKIETITNVGGEKELIKAKVAQDIPIRTLKAGTGITITQNANDLEIINSQPPPTSQAKIHIDIFARDDPRNWGNMPLALTELFDRTSLRIKTDLSVFTQARFVVNMDTIGVVGAELHPEYDVGSGFLELADTAGGGDVIIDTLGTLFMLDSGWFDVDALALVDDVVIRIVGSGGDGGTDPKFGHITLEFRT